MERKADDVADRLSRIDPIKREPAVSQVARKLMEYILSGEMVPGERMPSERQLAEAFGVGRSALREAIKSLSLMGLVEVRQGDGTYVKRADAGLLPEVIEWGLLLGEPRTLDLVEARQYIEVDIAGLAAKRRTDEDIAELARQLERMRINLDDHEGFVDADVAFHQRLVLAARNSALRDIHASIQALLRTWIRRVIASAPSSLPSYEEHVPIFEAVKAGDPAAAERAMDRHMTLAAERLAQTLQDGAAEAAAHTRGAAT